MSKSHIHSEKFTLTSWNVKKIGNPMEDTMESLELVIVFTLALVAIVALGRGVRGRFGGIEIVTKPDLNSKSKK